MSYEAILIAVLALPFVGSCIAASLQANARNAETWLAGAVVTGRRLGEEIDSADRLWPQKVVRTLTDPVHQQGGLAVLRGNLAPDGAIIKLTASHRQGCRVRLGLEHLVARIDDPQLEATAADILVLRNAGPKGSIGMPEAGQIPIPQKLAKQGVRDMVRISDARMSGTGSGPVVLHMSPEAALGGPLSRLRTGDIITLDVPNRRLNVVLDQAEFAARRPNLPADSGVTRGYQKLYPDRVLQAGDGCDLDFLTPRPFTAVAPI